MGSLVVTMTVVTCVSLGVLLLALVARAQGRICWEGCRQDQQTIQAVNIRGCRRRSSYPARQDFRCEGQKGPPCTVKRGDTVHLEARESHFSFPIKIESFYPAAKYPLKWKFIEKLGNGQSKELGCFLTKIKIV